MKGKWVKLLAALCCLTATAGFAACGGGKGDGSGNDDLSSSGLVLPSEESSNVESSESSESVEDSVEEISSEQDSSFVEDSSEEVSSEQDSSIIEDSSEEVSSEQDSSIVEDSSEDDGVVRHVVTFDAANGEEPFTQSVEHGEKIAKPADPIRAGYTFAGWTYMGENWSFIGYVVTENFTLTAQWTAHTNTLNFDGNGATNGTMSSLSAKTDETITLSACAYIRANYEFLGWATEKDGEVVYQDGERYTMGSENQYTLYAVWKKMPFEYKAVGNTYAIEKYVGEETVVEITAKYNNCPVTAIAENAFAENSTITEIKIPDTITDIDHSAFSNCNQLLNIEVDGGNLQYMSLDGNLYTKDGKTLIQYAIGKTDNSFAVSDSVTTIGGYAFAGCCALTEMVIADSVISIGAETFKGCDGLKDVTCSTFAMGYIPKTGLERVVITSGKSLDVRFSESSKLKQVVVFDGVESIGSSVFYGCNALEEITLPFVGASKTAKNGYDEVFGWIFGYTTSYRKSSWSIYSDSAENSAQYMGKEETVYGQAARKVYFYNIPTTLKKVKITSVETIVNNAFINCMNIESVGLPDGLTEIGSYAFSNCKALKGIGLPEGVTTIMGNAFNGCTALTEMETPDSLTDIGWKAFLDCSGLTRIVLKGSLQISALAFSGCTALTEVVISDDVQSIDYSAFDGCDNLQYTTKAGLKYLGNNDNPYLYLADKEDGDFASVTIENGCKMIGKEVFYANNSLTEVTIPSTVAKIDQYAFSHCSSLTSVTIADNSQLETIEFCTFASCINLTNIKIGHGVKNISGAAFSGCYSLTKILIPDSVISIGNSYSYAFSGCNALIIYCETDSKPSGWNNQWNYTTDFSCPVVWDCKNNDVASDGYVYTVQNGLCYGLKDGVAKAVRQPRNNTDVTIAETVTYKDIAYNVTSIDSEAFKGFKELTRVIIPSSVESVGYGAFKDCSNLSELVISKGVTSIGDYAFANCSSLSEVVIPDSMVSIDDYAFRNCSGLTSIYIPESVTKMGKYVVAGCTAVTIYCEVTSPPSGWNSSWRSSDTVVHDYPVVWGE